MSNQFKLVFDKSLCNFILINMKVKKFIQKIDKVLTENVKDDVFFLFANLFEKLF